MPMPLSCTSNRDQQLGSSFSSTMRARSTIEPRCGELHRVGGIVEQRLTQARRVTVAAHAAARARCRPPARVPWPAHALRSASRRAAATPSSSKSADSSLNLPASILEMSSTSLMIASRCCAEMRDLVQLVELVRRRRRVRAAGASGRGWRSSACGSHGSCWPGTRSWRDWPIRLRRRAARARR